MPKNTRKIVHTFFAYLAVKVVKHYSFLINTIFHSKKKFLYLSAANLKVIKNHVHFAYANYVTSCNIDTAVVKKMLFHFVYILSFK